MFSHKIPFIGKKSCNVYEIKRTIPRMSSMGSAPVKWATIRVPIQPNPKARKSCKYSLHKLAAGWTFRESTPSRGEIFRTRPDRFCGPPSLLYNGYWVKRPGRGVDHLQPSSAKVKDRVKLYLYFLSGPS